MTMIYQDDKRILEMDEHGQSIARAKNSTVKSWQVDLADESTTLSNTLPKGTAEVLRNRGDNSTGWYALMAHGHARAVLPPESRQAMALAIATAQAERRQIINDPQNVARRKVSMLFERARSFEDDPGRYFPALNEARAALKQWQERYPGAAKTEQRENLLADAQEFDQKASGALVYDADGSLSSDEQETRAAAFRAQASAKRAEAARL